MQIKINKKDYNNSSEIIFLKFSMSFLKKIEWGIYKINSRVIFFSLYVSGGLPKLSYIRIFMFFHVLRTQICYYLQHFKNMK